MKVIFLDIDGVLNSRAYDRKRNWNEQSDIDETRLTLVKEIVDATEAKIVLSSTWRQHWDKKTECCDEDGQYINKTFAKFGLSIFDKTPNLGITALRRDEISKWMKETEEVIDSFVIIDDYRYGCISCRRGSCNKHNLFPHARRKAQGMAKDLRAKTKRGG